MKSNDVLIQSHQYSCKLEILMKKVLPVDCPTQGEIRLNLFNSIESTCLKLNAEYPKMNEKILFFLNRYSSIGDSVDALIEMNGTEYVRELINDFEDLIKGCGLNV